MDFQAYQLRNKDATCVQLEVTGAHTDWVSVIYKPNELQLSACGRWMRSDARIFLVSKKVWLGPIKVTVSYFYTSDGVRVDSFDTNYRLFETVHEADYFEVIQKKIARDSVYDDLDDKVKQVQKSYTAQTRIFMKKKTKTEIANAIRAKAHEVPTEGTTPVVIGVACLGRV